MLFNIESDGGNFIRGYLVPDSFSSQAAIAVKSGDKILATVRAEEVRHTVVAAGRHETGLVGFAVNEDVVPGLSEASYLEICDVETGFVFYRRRPATQASEVRLFRLETGFRRMTVLDSCLDGLFQTAFLSVDAYGRETTSQTLLLDTYNSLYVSGRLLFKEYEYSLDDNFRKIAIIQDPYVELAATLLALRNGTLSNHAGFDLRTELSMGDCIDYFATLDPTNDHSLRRHLARMPDTIESAIANPLVRLLAGRPSEETANGSYIPSGLQSLASFDVVGLRNEPQTYLDPLAALLRVDRSTLQSDKASQEEMHLAAELRKHRLLATILEFDLELYEKVSRVIHDQADDNPLPS